MRFERLILKAYGAYSGRLLEFPPSPDFHVVYGPNEAGKSTTLRALIALLFGIDERTADRFRFGYEALRIGAVLRAADGTRLSLMRRKGRKSTLAEMDPVTLEERGTPVLEPALARMLGGLSESLYTHLFGLDYERLVEGGRALVEGKGEVGASLFEAGAGLASVRSLRAQLAAEAESLFKPRASTPELNRTLRAYDDARREVRERAVRSADWQQRKQAVEQAAERHRQARAEHERLLGEARRLERLRDLLPLVAERGLAQQRLEALRDVAHLAADAKDRRIQAETAIAGARTAIEEAQVRLARAGAERDALTVRDDVLAQASAITALYHDIRAYREARDARVAAQAAARAAEAQARALVAVVAPDLAREFASGGARDLAHPPNAAPTTLAAARPRIPDATTSARIEALAADAKSVRKAVDDAAQSLAELHDEVTRIEAELQALGTGADVSALAAFVESVADAGDPEARARALAREAEQEATRVERAAAELGAESADALARLVAPSDAEVDAWDARFAALDTERATARSDIAGLERDLADALARIAGLDAGGAAPTVERLQQARAERDRLWRAIRLHRLPEPGDPPPADPAPAAPTFEHALGTTDFLADVLFSDAQRATQLVELRKREQDMRAGLDAGRARIADSDARRAALTQAWTDCCAARGLPSSAGRPGSGAGQGRGTGGGGSGQGGGTGQGRATGPPRDVREIRRWLAERAAFVQKHDALEAKRAEAERVAADATATRERLNAALASAGLPACAPTDRLADGLARARATVKQAASNDGARGKLAGVAAQVKSRIARAEAEQKSAQSALELWTTRWSEAMARLGLPPDALPDEARARLRELAALGDALDAHDRETARATASGATVERFEAEAARLAALLEVAQGARAADVLADALHAVLQSTLAARSERDQLDARIRTDSDLIAREQRNADAAAEQLEVLVAAAGCADAAELVEVETRDADRRTFERELDRLAAEIARLSGMPLAQGLGEAEGRDSAEVQTALEVAESDRQRAAEAVEEAVKARDAAQRAFAEVDGTSAAAAAEQQAAEHAAHLASLATRYASARVASAILGHVIEDYQQRNQGPIVQRASELYRRITGGAFSQVAVDFDEERQILVAVRPNGERLTVDALSTGRRDQLFLALRLAAIERHIAANEPMPVVVDDLLVQFDDDAAAATLQVLAELAGRTQVLFFTHHEHLLAMAERAVARAGWVAHRMTSERGAEVS